MRRRAFNLIDVAILMLIVAAAALVVESARRLKAPAPQVSGVSPATLENTEKARITVQGVHLPPYLHAYLHKSGEPFILPVVASDERQLRVTESGPDRVVLVLPRMDPGVYDLSLFDDFQQIGFRRAALSVVRPEPPRADIDIVARFHVYSDVMRVIGGVDTPPPAAAPTPASRVASVLEVTPGPEFAEEQMRLAKYPGQDPYFFLGRRMSKRVVDVRLRVPAERGADGLWRYRNRPLRAGEPFALDTPTHHFEGDVTWVGTPVQGAEPVKP